MEGVEEEGVEEGEYIEDRIRLGMMRRKEGEGGGRDGEEKDGGGKDGGGTRKLPQGSILGPIPFLVYTADILLLNHNSQAIMHGHLYAGIWLLSS